MSEIWDCIVVGGGAAGLSAGLVLGRARRRTLLIDAAQQSNLSAHGIGGLLGHDGRPPAELYALGREELASYGVQIQTGEVSDIAAAEGAFLVRLADGDEVGTRRVLLATGMTYLPPELPGLAELWGRSVFHCPFCHGWEVRDLPLAVLADGDRAVHLALLLRCWSEDIVVLTGGPADLDAEDRTRLSSAGVRVDERPVTALEAHEGELSAVVFADGRRLPRRGLLVATALRQRDRLAERLGVGIAPPGPVAQDPVGVDQMCRTFIPGVFAAGDLTGEMPQVAGAIAAGSRAAAAVVQSLAADDYGLAMPPGVATTERKADR
ncbi:NAD(P)/FAD-dependent oxidoreductase [Mycolicibacter arupensis]|jgi:thioredoxin reductase|uniref:Pyridine nucleotide-disulfide oxidoreductase n=1 Tax=Mycolicibacter arupensis TaxID=342002 RepID=A0A0F5N0R8_9MYCO|nr:NAD(P)/FAD-dependent oxidoreductase [Mycolicibacter arupensis]KKC00621.1 pyridine nucleotide-disulfide oxidoreductase [Mycolicibacter arupensis]MCV7276747.1 NAD(P)/FAD-dependent oxidoreductase [Mycolicibacter arupensis]OQZ96568.1 pyridine nucleotide-disulfide oxidoreductase [Mycolicibacter arupensis]